MKLSDIKTGEDMQRMMRHHPVKMYFHFRLGLTEAIRENGEDAVDAMAEIAVRLLDLLRCIRNGFVQLMMFLLYPVAKALKLAQLRKRILKASPEQVKIAFGLGNDEHV